MATDTTGAAGGDPHAGPPRSIAPPTGGTGDGTAASGPESRRQLAVAFDSAPIGMAVTTDSGLIVRANTALGELLGYPPQALTGRHLEDLALPDVAEQLTTGREQMIASGTARHVTGSRLRCASGRPVPVTLTCARVPAAVLGPAYLVVHVQDSTVQQATEADLSHRALHDPLTGLPNRVLLIDRLERALARLARSPSSSVAVLFADLNEFKAVNDSHGHHVGDQVLVAVARRLQLLQRPGDTACRYGGDEFVVLCEDSGAAEADSVAQRIHTALATPIAWVNPDPHRPTASSVSLTASIGIAATSDPTRTAHQLLHDADSTMYRDKHQQADTSSR